MSYYGSKIAEMRRLGVEVRELGDEIAIISGGYVVVGGDAPTMIELSGATPEQSRRLADLGRAVNGEAEYTDYLSEIGAREVSW